MLSGYGDVNSPYSRAVSAFDRWFMELTGVAPDPKMAVGKIAELAIRRSIEVVEGTAARDDRHVGMAKDLMAGKLATPQQVADAAMQAQFRLQQALQRIIGTAGARPTTLQQQQQRQKEEEGKSPFIPGTNIPRGKYK